MKKKKSAVLPHGFDPRLEPGPAPKRPKVAGEPQFVRLTDDLLRRVEAHRVAMEARGEGSTKSDAMRALIIIGLDASDDSERKRLAASDSWRVWRHGGRRTDHWRLIFSGPEKETRAAYVEQKAGMRQGRLRLMRRSGLIWEEAVRERDGSLTILVPTGIGVARRP